MLNELSMLYEYFSKFHICFFRKRINISVTLISESYVLLNYEKKVYLLFINQIWLNKGRVVHLIWRRKQISEGFYPWLEKGIFLYPGFQSEDEKKIGGAFVREEPSELYSKHERALICWRHVVQLM